jgi:hypothetical protein
LLKLIQSLKEAKDFIATTISTAWNEFYENVWKKRCEAFICWEKEAGISMKIKKKLTKGKTSQGVWRLGVVGKLSPPQVAGLEFKSHRRRFWKIYLCYGNCLNRLDLRRSVTLGCTK